MKQEILTISSEQDALPLSTLLVMPDCPARGIFQLSHGMAENKERYLPLMTFLAEKGYICIIHDHRGHGASVRSAQDLGYLYENADTAIVEDLHQITLYAKSRFPQLPLYLMGHSMGSLVVRCYLMKYAHELSALIVCGSPSANPAAGAALAVCRVLTAIYGDRHRSRLITRMAFGSYGKRFPENTENAWLSANPENVRDYNASPLCGFLFTLNGYRALFHLLRRTYSEKEWADTRSLRTPADVSLPVRFLAGEEDPCIASPEKFREACDFLRRQGFSNVSSKLFCGMRHEIHNETGKAEVWNDIAAFLSLPESAPADEKAPAQ